MSGFKYEYYASVKSKTIDWLWYPYIPYGKLTIVQGDPGEGKSTFIINVAALLTKGLSMPDGFPCEKAQTVIYQCAEDNISDTVKPRLEAAGADCSKIAYIVDDDGSLNFEDERIEKVITETGARLFVIDPIQAFLVQDTDMQSAARMRSVLRRLSAVAEKYNCAVVLVGHLTKAQSDKKLYRGLGSIDIAAIARSVLMIARDKYDSEMRYMFPVKSSLAPFGSAIGFGFNETKGFYWTGKCDIDYGDYDEGIRISASKEKQAEFCIVEQLKNGPATGKDVYSAASEMGISERTVQSAKKKLGVESFRKGDSWYWRLPEKENSTMEVDDE